MDEIQDYDRIDSIDDLEQEDRTRDFHQLHIPPIEEFWGHSSNLQVWFENDYDTRLLHSNLAFPLLKKLTEVGDPIAKRVFKEEIFLRFSSNHLTVMQFLLNEGYLRYFNEEEIKFLLEEIEYDDIKNLLYKDYFTVLRQLIDIGDMKALGVIKEEIVNQINEGDRDVLNFLLSGNYFSYFTQRDLEIHSLLLKPFINKLIFWGSLNNAPKPFYRNIDKLQKNIELAKLGVKKKAPRAFYDNFESLLSNIELTKLAIEKRASYAFYENFEILLDDIELVEIGIQNRVPSSFYYNFEKIKSNKKLAKWGIQNKAKLGFYGGSFRNIQKNEDLAKWGVKNNAPHNFFSFFGYLIENVDLAKWAVQNNAPKIFYRSFPILRKNEDLARWAVQNEAPKVFYQNFNDLMSNIKRAKMGVSNNAPNIFYFKFKELLQNVKMAEWAVSNRLRPMFYRNFVQIVQDPYFINSLRIAKVKKEVFLEQFWM